MHHSYTEALLEQKDAFAVRILTQAGADANAAAAYIDRFIARQPKVGRRCKQQPRLESAAPCLFKVSTPTDSATEDKKKNNTCFST